MAPEAVAAWDRAVANLKAAGAIVDAFDAPVTAPDYQDLFAAAAWERGDVAVNDWTPPPTVNALYLYFAGRSDDPRGDMRKGYPAYQANYSDLPKTFEEAEKYLEAPMAEDPAGQSFARSRASVVRQLTDAMRKAEVQAMVWPTMPFNASPIDGKWPKIRTTLSYNNWLGLPEVSVPSGYDADGMPALNLSVVGFPGDDLRVLALAHAYERQSTMFRFPPVR
jgi:Asp-tRNA(Asn)/Glu-tRNA(Gln) amidotransferase A subunit family amidase